jgi:hypothetical protein
MPWRSALVAPAVIVLVAAVLFVPFLATDREQIVSTPQPPPLFNASPIGMLLGTRVCANPVPIDASTDVARLRAARFGDAVTPAVLAVSVTAPGYRVSKRFSDYEDGAALDLPLPDPPRALDAELCIENWGPKAAIVGGSAETRTHGRMTATVDGKPSASVPILSLIHEPPASLASRTSDLFDRAGTVGPVSGGVLGVLALLVVLGIPVALTLALRRGQP